MMKTRFSPWLWVGMLAGFTAHAHAQLVQGRDYEIVRPAKATADPRRIEVLEYFSWGCGGCNQLYPHLAKWATKLPSDVNFVKAAVSLGHEQWVPLARGYYALGYTGDLKRLEGAVFQAVHEKRLNLFSPDRFAQWAGQQGADAPKVLRLMQRDMSVDKDTTMAEANSRSIPIDGTPFILVDGKYRLVGAAAQSYADWPALIDRLIALARSDRARANKSSSTQ